MAAKSADARVLSNNSHQNNNWDGNGGNNDCRDMNHNIDAEDRNNNGGNYTSNRGKFLNVLSQCLLFFTSLFQLNSSPVNVLSTRSPSALNLKQGDPRWIGPDRTKSK